jgi:AhpD family alkylhydroperoxidase
MQGAAMNTKFRKTTYRGLRDFFADLGILVTNGRAIVDMMRKGTVSPEFRERLMLAVTSVYGCRFCSWAHTREALKRGLSQDDITSLLSGSMVGCPAEEALAILYAQHWAESNGRPDAMSFQRLVEVYGKEKAAAIALVLRMVRVGNLTGNSWDYLLYRATFGRWVR